MVSPAAREFGAELRPALPAPRGTRVGTDRTAASRHPWARCAARGVRSTRTPLRGVGPVVWGGSASPFDLVPGRAARARARAAAWRTWVRDACRVSRTVRRVPPPAGRRVSAARFSQTVQGPAVRGWRWQVPFAPARTATRTRDGRRAPRGASQRVRFCVMGATIFTHTLTRAVRLKITTPRRTRQNENRNARTSHTVLAGAVAPRRTRAVGRSGSLEHTRCCSSRTADGLVGSFSATRSSAARVLRSSRACPVVVCSISVFVAPRPGA